VPSYPAGRLEDCFTTKLGATASRGTGDKEFEFYDDDGRYVTSTWLSRSWRGTTAVDPSMVSKIQRQMKLQGRPQDFARLVRCPMSRQEWLRLAGVVVRDSP